MTEKPLMIEAVVEVVLGMEVEVSVLEVVGMVDRMSCYLFLSTCFLCEKEKKKIHFKLSFLLLL